MKIINDYIDIIHMLCYCVKGQKLYRLYMVTQSDKLTAASKHKASVGIFVTLYIVNNISKHCQNQKESELNDWSSITKQ